MAAGGQYLAGRPALVDYRLGAGHVVLFGMSPQYRAQSYRTFKLLFNAFLPLGAVAGPASEQVRVDAHRVNRSEGVAR